MAGLGAGSITAVQVKQSMLSPLKLEVDPNIQSMCNQEKEQIKSLNKFVSFIDKVRSLEQKDKILKTKWNLLQQQKMTHSNMDNISRATSTTFRGRGSRQFGNMQGLVKYLKNKYEDEINKSTEIDNEFVLIRDVDEAYMNKVELDHLEGLTVEINFYRQLYEEEICELQVQISDMSVVLSMDNNHTLDLDGIVAEVKISNCSHAKAETMYQVKYKKLQTLVGQHRKTEISESPLQAEIEGLKGQRASLKATFADAKWGAQAKVVELEATLRAAKQDMAQQLCEYQELMNLKLTLDMEIATYQLLEGEENRRELESGTQNMSIHTKTTSGYSGVLSPTYGNLNYGLGFQANGYDSFSYTSTSSSKTVVVKEIETLQGKLVSESDVLFSSP
uniref:Keratin, type II cytoskeletal 8 n=1 Tax=Myotis lucifugus TaxID=59463 RepID=G1Q220_MYOLU